MQKKDKLQLCPIKFREACTFLLAHHRHHKPPQGHIFSIACSLNSTLVGVATVGRPVSRHLDNGHTLEVTRLATDGTANACSFLYSASWRTAKALGYEKIITYILSTEPGTSLRAAGWTCLGKCGGGSWSRKSRSRETKHPTQTKIKYEKTG